jgi:hypothetical protein
LNNFGWEFEYQRKERLIFFFILSQKLLKRHSHDNKKVKQVRLLNWSRTAVYISFSSLFIIPAYNGMMRCERLIKVIIAYYNLLCIPKGFKLYYATKIEIMIKICELWSNLKLVN